MEFEYTFKCILHTCVIVGVSHCKDYFLTYETLKETKKTWKKDSIISRTLEKTTSYIISVAMK